jgi:hypothetical protein
VREITEAEARAEANRRVRKALDHIQEAQNHLGRAQAELSALEHGAVVWKAAGALYDRVHAFWHRVEAFRQKGRFRLDSIARESLAKRLSEEAPRA